LKRWLGKQFISILFASALCLIVIPLAHALNEDIAGHWAEKPMLEWTNKGLLTGYEDGTLRPSANVTRAEFVAMINRLFGFTEESGESFSDVHASLWYADHFKKAKEAGYFTGYPDGSAQPDNNISRQEAAAMLYRAYRHDPHGEEVKLDFRDEAELGSWSREAVEAFVKLDYLKGYPDGTFRPAANLTRAEAVKLLSNSAGELIHQAGEYSITTDGSVFIHNPDVILKDSTIEGNLWIAEGIGEGDVEFVNVTVKGEVTIRGGGENSILLQDSTIGALKIDKKNGKIRIVATGKTQVDSTELRSGATLVEQLTGDAKGFGDIEIGEQVSEEEVVALLGQFDEVNVNGPIKQMNIPLGTIIKKFTLHVNGKITVSGQGVIEHAIIVLKGAELGVLDGVIKKLEELFNEDNSSGGGNGNSNPGGDDGPGHQEEMKISGEVHYDAVGRLVITGDTPFGANKEVTVQVLDALGQITYLNQTTSGKNGAFRFEYQWQDDDAYGDYRVLLSGEGMEATLEIPFEASAA
jgi:hypothetical protein